MPESIDTELRHTIEILQKGPTTIEKTCTWIGPGQQISIVVSAGGEKRSINEFLPSGWKLIEIPDAEPSADPNKKEIEIPEEKGYAGKDGRWKREKYLLCPGSFAMCFHEFRHAQLAETNSPEFTQEQLRLRNIVDNPLGYDNPSTQTRKAYRQLVVTEEVEAWRYAFEMLDFFEKLGIPLEPNITHEDLVKYRDYHLGKYLRV